MVCQPPYLGTCRPDRFVLLLAGPRLGVTHRDALKTLLPRLLAELGAAYLVPNGRELAGTIARSGAHEDYIEKSGASGHGGPGQAVSLSSRSDCLAARPTAKV
jgi:hypothetical protein